MIRTSLPLLLLSALSAPVLAQTGDGAMKPTPPDATGNSYPAAFYAANQPATALDMINRTPGFILDVGEAARGFTDNAGNVLINGRRPTSKNDGLATLLNRIPASRVERIDVLRGAVSGVDMLGKTVIANVVVKADAATTAAATVSDYWSPQDGRQAPRVKLEVSRKHGETSLDGSLDIYRGFDTSGGRGSDMVTDATGRVLLNQRYLYTIVPDNLVATAAYSLPFAGGSLRINGQASIKRLNTSQIGTDLAPMPTADSSERDAQHAHQFEFGVTYDRNLGPRLGVETLFLQRIDRETYNSRYSDVFETDIFDEGHRDGESIARTTLTWKPSAKISVITGGEAAFNWFNSETTYSVNGSTVRLPAASVQIREVRGEAFLRGTWVISPRLTLESGLRLEVSRLTSIGDVGYERTLFYPKPRLALTWSIDDRNQIRGRVEREVSQLSFTNFTAISSLTTGQVFTGNPALSPQEAVVAEVTYDRQFLKTGELVLTYRHSQIANVIDRAIVTAASGIFEEPANIGDGGKDEWITSLNLPINIGVVRNTHLSLVHTWRLSSVTDPTTRQHRAISGLVPSTGTIELYQDLQRLRATWGISYDATERERYYSYNLIETDRYLSALLVYIEAKPVRALSLRFQVGSIGTGAQRTLENYSNTRLGAQPQSVENRRLRFGPLIGLRLRRDL